MRVRGFQQSGLLADQGRGSGGYTLVEVMISIALVLLVTGGVSNLLQGGSRSFQRSSGTADLDTRILRTMRQLVTELSVTGDTTVTDQLVEGVATTDLVFQPSMGRTDGEEQWGDVRELGLVMTTGERANGVDDNGNGSIDEWELVLTERPGEDNELDRTLATRISFLAEGEVANGLDDNGNGLVDEPGFYLLRDGSAVTLWLTVERVEDGWLTQRSSQRVLTMKN